MIRHLALAGLVLLVAACSVRPIGDGPILLFTGAGTSREDVTALESILDEQHLPYSTADSRQLNALDESQLRRHRLLIVPGGNFLNIGSGLTAATADNIRRAVHGGMNYLGVCAGAFFAGDSPNNGLNLTGGVRFGFYSAEARGIRKAAVPIAIPSGRTLDVYWEDGPQLSGWGAIVATYPDGTPAVVEGSAGNGWVLLSGVHPEAPADWRRGLTFATPVAADREYAATLIRSALNGVSLAHP